MKSKSPILDIINNWFLRFFIGIWGVFVILDYLQKTPYFTKALAYCAYWDLVVTLLIFSALFVLLSTKNRRIGWTVVLEKLTGWKIYALLLFFMTIIFAFFGLRVNLFIDGVVKGISHLLFLAVYIQAAVFFIILLAFGIGNWFLDGLDLKLSSSSRALIDIATGFSVLVLALFLAGMFRMLNTWVTWIAVLVCMAMLWPRILSFGKKILILEFIDVEIHTFQLLPVIVLLIFVAMNLMAMIRPIPIGFDALNLYMNTPKLIDEYQGLTKGGHAYNWSILMSLGFILFNSTPITLALSIMPGILSLFVIYRLACIYMNAGWSILVVALFYTMPSVLWQSTSEAKVDLAALYVMLSAILLILEYGLTPRGQTDFASQKSLRPGPLTQFGLFNDLDLLHWALAGWLMGFAFGIKYTCVFAILSCICLIFYRYHSKWAFWTSFLMCFLVVFCLDLYQFSSVVIDKAGISELLTLLFYLFIGLFVYSWINDRKSLLYAGKLALTFGIAVGLTFLPWVAKNLGEAGELSMTALTNGKKAQKPLNFYHRKPTETLNTPVNKLLTKPSAMPLNPTNKTNIKDWNKLQQRDKTGIYEEINRYIGYERGVIRFFSLFYDLTTKTNVRSFIVDVGFVLFLFIPLGAFSRKGRHFVYNIGKAVIFVLLLIFSIWSVHSASENAHLYDGLKAAEEMRFTENLVLNKTVQPLLSTMYRALLYSGDGLSGIYHYLTIQDTTGIYFIVIFSVLVLYFLYRQVLNELSKQLKWLLAFSVTYFMFWLVFSSGIIWYGIAGLALGPLIVIVLIRSQKGAFASDKLRCGLAIGFIGIWLFLSLVIRLTNVSKADLHKASAKQLYFKHFANYQAGIYTKEQCFDAINPAYASALTEINRDEKAGILRIGTYIKYYIRNNDKRVYTDSQLDIFNNLHGQFSSQQRITAALKTAGIRYIVLDLNAAAYDVTPQKSLTAKVKLFYKYLYNNPYIELISTDRLVVDHASNKYADINNRKIPVNNQVFGNEIVHWGIIAVYKIT